MAVLRLGVRTPRGLLYDSVVSSIVAEDASGWFGVLPGRTDLIATLVPGLLLFEDDEGEGFVALAGGLLNLRAGQCRVMAREAVLTRNLEAVEETLDASIRDHARRVASRGDVIDGLTREAMRRLATERRSTGERHR